jgi:serine/threonine protein kinase
MRVCFGEKKTGLPRARRDNVRIGHFAERSGRGEWIGVKVGEIVGDKYRLLRQIGEGGMGSVWSAVHLMLDRQVAIKFLNVCGADAAIVSERFAREAQSAARVSHRYVVDVFDFGVTEDGVHYMVQELLSGESLAHCMGHGPAWDVRDLLRFIGRCLAGLDAVHTAGIVHRDMKPENVFVARDTEGPFPKLLDFGICHVRRATISDPPPSLKAATNSPNPAKAKSARKHLSTMTEGTPAYMAPEQLRGQRDLDGRADLYSVGVMLYEWLTGRLPYEQGEPAELVAAIDARTCVPLCVLRPDLGAELSDIVQRTLAPERNERFSSAAELRAELLALVPSMPDALAMVQGEMFALPIGTKTERILSAAASPFAADEPITGTQPALVMENPWRARVPTLAAVAAFVLLGTWGLSRLSHMGASESSVADVAAPQQLPPVIVEAPAPEAKVEPEPQPLLAVAEPVEAAPEEVLIAPSVEPVVAAPVEPAPAPVAQAAVVPAAEVARAKPAPRAPAAKARKNAAPETAVALAKARMVRDAQRAAGIKPRKAEPSREPTRPLGEPLREVRLEMAVQSAESHESEGPVEERQLTGVDIRRLGL